MALLPARLSDLLDDYTDTFWDGDGTLSVETGDLAAALAEAPDITVKGLKRLTPDGLLQAGISITADPGNIIRLGKDGAERSLALGLDAAVDAWIFLVVDDAGFDDVRPETFEDLGQLLRRHTVLEGDDGLAVVSFSGTAGVDLSASLVNKSAVRVGVKFGGEVSYAWFGCRSAGAGRKATATLLDTVAGARLPHTSVASANDLRMERNEVLLSRFVGSLTLGAETTFGYDLTASTGHSLGDLDLTSRLDLEIGARLALAYQLGGGFLITVRRGSTDDHVRVVVEKDHSSAFDFSFGVGVAVEATTKGLSDKDVALGLVESILGLSTPQIVHEIRDLAGADREALQERASGFLRGLLKSWVGDLSDDEALDAALQKLIEVRDAIAGIDDRVLQLYERFRKELTVIDEVIVSLEQALDETDPDKARQLLAETLSSEGALGDAAPLVRDLLERLAGEALSAVLLKLEEHRKPMRKAVADLKKLANPDVEGLIEEFLDEKKKSLGLKGLFEKLENLQSLDDVEEEILELVDRLIDKPLDTILNTPAVDKVLDDVRKTAASFESILAKIDKKILAAAAATGRLALAVAYHRESRKKALVDVEIHLQKGNLSEAKDAYEAAVRGDFATLFADHDDLLTIHGAAFTSILDERTTLEAHVFGLDFKRVNTLLQKWDFSIQASKTGRVTAYSFMVETGHQEQSDDRTTSLAYALTLVGVATGAIPDLDTLGAGEESPLAMLGRVDSQLSYEIRDRFASYAEISEYFRIGHEQLGILSEGQYRDLVEAAAHIDGLIQGKPDIKSVTLDYAMHFEPEALVRALSTDLTGTPVPCWRRDGTVTSEVAGSHTEALERLYVDRLVACRVAPPPGDKFQTYVPFMFQYGIFDRIKKKSTGYITSPTENRVRYWTQLYVKDRGGKERKLRAPRVRFNWCAHHYNVAVGLAKFLDEFRAALTSNAPMSRSRFTEHLTELTLRLRKMGTGQSKALPFMLLDTLVQRTAQDPLTARKGVLEVTFYDDDKKPLQYLPIVT